MHESSPREVISPLGEGLSGARQLDGNRLTVVVRMQTGSDCVLHWGLSPRPGGAWQRPPDDFWPRGTAPAGAHAVHTPLSFNGRGEREVAIQLDLPCPWRALPFVVYFPREQRWLKSGERDFTVPLPRSQGGVASPTEALEAWVQDTASTRQVFPLDGGGQLAAAVVTTPEGVRVQLACDVERPLILHWGLVWRFRHEWQLPPEEFRPAGTTVFDALAVRTPFAQRDGMQSLELEFTKPADGPIPRGLKFVLFQPEGGAWLKSGGADLYLPLAEEAPDPRLPSPKLWDLAERFVAVEKGAGSWTLMHRYNLCHDLLDAARDDEDALALLFAWLRYSAIRQLDWQRRYNTKPRELSHAQDRLTARLAGVWRRASQGPEGAGRRLWARRMLTTLGRGGDGQRIRDEILQIMHRNHIKEVSGHFIEEWHQKLHNNTTPDDVVICQAYLEFLKSNGDRNRFYQTLEAGGVTRERLQSFERPIRSEPDFYADRKDALIGEFEHFLRIVKAVHAGTDLESAVGAARGRLDGGMNQRLDGLLGLRHRQPPVGELAAAVVAAREGLKGALAGARDDAALRDLLFLDLALEDTLRSAVERQNLSQFDRDGLVNLIQLALQNLGLSTDAPELSLCANHWAKLSGRPRDGRDWALHARSVADRAAHWVQEFTGELYRRLQPKAEFLGAAFEVAAWTVQLFSEEVIRGDPAFALSLLLRHLDPILRKAAGLGGWQVISPARAAGRVRVVDRLAAVQAERFAEPTVLIADAVSGSEEIPAGVTAVLTADTPDLLAHAAVRARNAGVLLATCYEAPVYERLKGMRDLVISLRVTPGGDVEQTEGDEGLAKPLGGNPWASETSSRALSSPLVPKPSSRWVVTRDEFTPQIVGAKSNNLNRLRGRLPDWIRLPASLALPFGAFEKALADGTNRELRGRYEALLATSEQDPDAVLARVRALLQELAAPAALRSALQEACPRVGLAAPPWEQAWQAIRRVWASKWNERAYLSRRARGVPHDRLLMAVLIQQVVPAEYAYVIHTVNPLTGNRAELFAEVVLGLGETLVGNYPGRALGFVCRKSDLSVQVVSYPGKSVGLYGQGLIFRSDSNGEDLEGFAGAGLYDSFLAEEPERRTLDYTDERLVWDEGFRNDLLRTVARVGLEVEHVLGSAQDIEGAVTGGQFYVVQTRPQVGLGGR
jgi:alpha-glucan,water dikinase